MSELRIIVAASRPIVQTWFAAVARQSDDSVLVMPLPLHLRTVVDATDLLASASVAVVDACVDPPEARAISHVLRADRPSLPIVAAFCCPESATAADLRGLFAAGVGGVLDLQLPPDETLRVLQGVARGQGAFHLQLAAGPGTSLRDLFAKEPAADELSDDDRGLLQLVALGLSDHEIGRQLYLSPHTVKHRIDRLRHRVHARNRVHLAAWVGDHLQLPDGMANGQRGVARSSTADPALS
jgi:DNA-binding NarL/FixJ family response regulator